MGNIQQHQLDDLENLITVEISKGLINYLRIHHYQWLSGIAAEMVINGANIENAVKITGVTCEEICKLINVKH